MKIYFYVPFLLLFCVFFTGCSRLVRLKKNKASDMKPVCVYDDLYEKQTPEVSMAVYRQAFIDWKASHGELVESLSSSLKRRSYYYNYSLDYLSRMQGLLKQPLNSDLKIYMDRYKHLKKDLFEKNLRSGRCVSLQVRLNHIYRDVVKDFSPRHASIQANFDEKK